MKVLHVSETMMGGVGTHLNELVPRQQARLGVDNVAFLGPFEALVQIPDIDPQSVHTFRRRSRTRGLPLLALSLVKLLWQFKPDVVHAHSTFAGLVVRCVAPFFRVPIVYCPHGWSIDRYKDPLFRNGAGFVEWAFSYLSARIIAVSESERLRGVEMGIPEKKFSVIYNGMRPSPPSFVPIPWEDARLKILFVGRLDRQKGIDVLLRAVRGLEAHVTVRVIGDCVEGGEAVLFESYPHVMPLGWQKMPEVAAHVTSCDVVVMPSRWEGLPYVALEAMRLGKPVVATRVGGMEEAVIDGKTGYLFSPEDSKALRSLLTSLDAATCQRLGQAGLERFAAVFSAEKMETSILEVYEEVVSSRQRG